MGEKKIDLTQTTLAVLFIGLLIVASLWTIWPFVSAAVWATMIVIATWPILIRIQAALWNSRRAAVGVMVVALLLLMVLPLLMALASLIENVDEISAWVVAFKMPPAPEFLGRIPMVGEELVRAWNRIMVADMGVFISRAAPHFLDAAKWLVSTAGGIGSVALHLVLTVIVAGLLYANGETAARGLRAFGQRLAGERGSTSVSLAGQAIRGVALGVVVTAFIQAVIGSIGLSIAGVPHVALLAAVMFVLCVAQIGPILVLVPAAIWLFWSGDATWGTFLLVWSIPVVVLDNVLRAVLIKKGVDLPLPLIFLGVIGGLIGFGLVGIFVGPVILAVTYKLLVAWVTEPRPA
jgi:predicted PurR-regulated permease PerM